MADQEIPPYVRSTQPQIPGGERQWLEQELKKLEDTLRAIIEAIKELQTP